jgi:leader peptidase (prepilin peptidase)/N-methyltransferase
MVKENIHTILQGFQRDPCLDEDCERGYDLYPVRGWDSPALFETQASAAETARQYHIPQHVTVIAVTQPQGHSTSGSHERYKTPVLPNTPGDLRRPTPNMNDHRGDLWRVWEATIDSVVQCRNEMTLGVTRPMDAATPIVAGLTGVMLGAPVVAMSRRVGADAGTSSATVAAQAPKAGQSGWTVVVVCGVASAIAGAGLPMSIAAVAIWIFATVSVVLAWIDMRVRRLPHPLTGGLWVGCGLLLLVQAILDRHLHRAADAAVIGLGTTTVFFLIALAMPGQLGLGDVVYAGAVALTLGWFGWTVAFSGVMIALIGQALVVLAAAVIGRRSATLPLGPALAAGWLVAVVVLS